MDRVCLLPSLMIPGPGVDLEGPVDLLQDHHPGQMVGEGHGGHGQAQMRLLFDGWVETEGAADDQGQVRGPVYHPALQGLGKLGAGQEPALHAQGDALGAFGQLFPDAAFCETAFAISIIC